MCLAVGPVDRGVVATVTTPWARGTNYAPLTKTSCEHPIDFGAFWMLLAGGVRGIEGGGAKEQVEYNLRVKVGCHPYMPVKNRPFGGSLSYTVPRVGNPSMPGRALRLRAEATASLMVALSGTHQCPEGH